MQTRAQRAAHLAAWLLGRKRPVRVEQIAARYGLSVRSAYRLVDDLRTAGILLELPSGYLARPPRK